MTRHPAGAAFPLGLTLLARSTAKPATAPPLTVAEAARRERVSDRTIRRWLPALAAADGAWRIGTQWRIDPWRSPHAVRPRARTAEPQRPKRRRLPTPACGRHER